MNIEDLKPYGIEGFGEGKLIIDLSSECYRPCKRIALVLEKLSEKGLFSLIQINTDQNSKLAQDLNIYAVPPLLFFKDGKLLEKDIKIQGQTIINNGVMIGAT